MKASDLFYRLERNFMKMFDYDTIFDFHSMVYSNFLQIQIGKYRTNVTCGGECCAAGACTYVDHVRVYTFRKNRNQLFSTRVLSLIPFVK